MDNFMIKDATKRLGIEAHVLRYWEEELGLEIKRNSMGHRYYEEKDLRMFSEIKRLRADGVPLKDIKKSIEKARKKTENISNEGTVPEDDNKTVETSKDTHINDKSEEKGNLNSDKENTIENAQTENYKEEKNSEISTGSELSTDTQDNIVDFKIAQMQTLMNRMVANAFRENKGVLTNTIKSEITEDVMKQMDIIMREKEEREEARFRKLDECLRQIQRANEEVAATKSKRLFGRKRH
ncbi:MAG: helix-turn-helix domain-containing protein [Lachnospiraceae bacterium]|nr:helix-turn-helix domain-containing protein [Lachnospiraceae bacterium]